MPSPNEKTFEIGLVMAGAVSAGAYTAGVMDYLLGALEAWQHAKVLGENVPTHNISIKVMTGASAGGMTTAITAVEILRRANNPQVLMSGSYKSLMYQAWVEEIDITKLLQTNDLKISGPIKSLLDSTIIDKIAHDIIDVDKLPPYKPLPYISEELKIFITLSNLRGLPYEFKLEGETGFPYGMTDHADYQYVEIKNDTPKADWIKLRNAAMATGAFPVGLASRLIERDIQEYKTRIHKDGREISGLMKIETSENQPYNFVAVDGGTLNNEPIELARSVWEKLSEAEKVKIKSVDDLEAARRAMRQKASECLYALIMVDPFPDVVDGKRNATEEDTALISTLGPIVGALRSQSLFKIEELLRAGDLKNNDRFLIAPIRYTETDKLAENAIACGFFSGFGGFLAREFREHDYKLGRRNCQRFLEKYFGVTAEKAIANGWKVNPDYFDPLKNYYPVIPIIKGSKVSERQGENNLWPMYKKTNAEKLKKGLTVRVRALLQKMLPFGWVGRTWVTVVMIVAVLLVLAGEYIKAMHHSGERTILLEGLKNSYILIFQIILILVLVVLLVLRVGKKSMELRLVNQAYKIFLSHMRRWGIREE